jgi:hypothetical protein
MSLLATTTLAALLVANPASTDADRVAANGGFLLGNAHRCGISEDRVVHGGKIVHDLIVAAASDSKSAEDATMRYATFFVVSAYPDQHKEKFVASCKVVDKELTELEKHPLPEPETAAAVGTDDDGVDGVTTPGARPSSFRLSDGE